MTPHVSSRQITLVGGPHHGEKVTGDPTREHIETVYDDGPPGSPSFGRALYRQEIISYGTEDEGGRTQTVRTYRIWLWTETPRSNETAEELAPFITTELAPEVVERGVPLGGCE